MTNDICPSVTNINPTYPEINQEVLQQLRKIPEIVLASPVLDNGLSEVTLIERSVHETLKVIENNLTLVGVVTEPIEVTEGGTTATQMQLQEVKVENLSTQYFDMVSN